MSIRRSEVGSNFHRSCRQPLVYLLLFYASRLDPEGLAGSTGSMKTSGRHLRLMGKLKVTGSLLPLRQTALLTTFMETLFFWSPLVPLLSLNLAMHLCQRVFKSDLWVATWQTERRTADVSKFRGPGMFVVLCTRLRTFEIVKSWLRMILSATVTNLLLFDMAVWSFQVKVQSDVMNQGAFLEVGQTDFSGTIPSFNQKRKVCSILV